MKALFVSGSDTGVGKTTVGAAIAAAAVRRGLRVAVAKPAESGCLVGSDGEPVPADASVLREAAGGWQSLRDVCPFPLLAPLAPELAAGREGRSLERSALVEAVHRVAAHRPDLLLAEGAGGLLVPLARDALVVDLAVSLGYPVLLVARAGLGTINHSLMSVEAARRRGLTVAGVVLSDGGEPPTEPRAIAENAAVIAERAAVPLLGCLPPLAGPTRADPDRLADAAERHLDLDRLLADAG